MEELCPDALLLNYVNPMAMICWALGTTERPVRRAVPRRADHAGPDRRLRGRAQGRDRLPVRRHQPHGLVPEAGAPGPGPLPAAARALRAARVLRQREGARRGLPPLRLLHDRVHRPPVRVPALLPQEPEGARPLLRRAGLRRRDAAPTTTGANTSARSTTARTSWPTSRPPCRRAASSTAPTSSRRWRPAARSSSTATCTTTA